MAVFTNSVYFSKHASEVGLLIAKPFFDSIPEGVEVCFVDSLQVCHVAHPARSKLFGETAILRSDSFEPLSD